MTTRLVQQAKVRTNTTKDSLCDIKAAHVTFAKLWDNYATGDPYNDPTYKNQCAIRMSVTLHRIGVEMKSFSQQTVNPGAGKQSIGRVLIDGKATATRADEMAAWLKLQPFCGLPPRPEYVIGRDWQTKIKGRTGIVSFANYWRRDGEAEDQRSGGHIDLWNGSRLTNNGVLGTLETFARFTLGADSGPGYSDLGNSKEILFWQIK